MLADLVGEVVSSIVGEAITELFVPWRFEAATVATGRRVECVTRQSRGALGSRRGVGRGPDVFTGCLR